MADPFAAFEGRYGAQSGGGGDVWSGFENRFSIAKMNPANSQRAGGLENINVKQLASLGYKPSDLGQDYERKVMGKQFGSAGDTFARLFKDLSDNDRKKLLDQLSKTPDSPIKDALFQRAAESPGASTKSNLLDAFRQIQDSRSNQALSAVAPVPTLLAALGAAKAIPKPLKSFSETYNQNLLGGLGREAVNIGNAGANLMSFGLNRNSNDRSAQMVKDALFPEQGTKNSLSSTKREDLDKWGRAGQLAGSGSKLATEIIGTGAIGNVAKSVAAGSSAVQALTNGGRIAQLGAKAIPLAAESLASTGVQTVGNGGDLKKGIAEGLAYDAAFNLVTHGLGKFVTKINAPEALTKLIDSQRDIKGVLKVIGDANVSSKVKKQLTGEVDRLSQLALPSPSGKVSGNGFTMSDAPNLAVTGASNRLKSIERTLSDASSGKKQLAPDAFKSLKSERDDILQQMQTGNFQPPARQVSNAVGEDFSMGAIAPGGIVPTPKSPAEIKVAEILDPNYAKQQAQAVKDASKSGIRDKLSEIKRKFSTGALDDVAILENTARKANPNLKASEDIGYLVDRTRRSEVIAQQFGQDSGLDDIIRSHGGKDFDEASIFLRDKRALELYKNTGENMAGVDLSKAAKNVELNSARFSDLSAKTQEYNKQFLDKVAEYGLISRDTADMLRKQNPDYVPFNRVMDEVEKSFGSGSPVSLSSQSVVKAINGSERQVKNVFENMYENMGRAVQQGERNNAAKALASYADTLEGNPFGIREIKPSEAIGNKNVFSFLDGGVKRTFEIAPEFKDAVKGMNGVEIGLLGKIFQPSARILKMGATGLNVVFGVRNVPKDQQFSFIVGKHPILSVKNFFNAIGDTAGLGKFGDEMARYGGGTIEADVFRKMGKTVNQLRAERSLGSNLAYKAVRPNQWLRSVENTIGKTEELTRTMNARSYYDAAKKAGKSHDDAMREAVNAYNKVSVDFLRAGSVTRQLNSVIPYLNPGVQGTRTFLKAMKERPVATGAKLLVGVYAPMAAVTAFNMADPERRKIWNEIPQYEKEGSLILVLPGAKSNGKGGFSGLVKLPVNPAFGAINGLIGKGVESAFGKGGVTGEDAVRAILETVQPLSTEPGKLIGSLTPQVLKPGIEQFSNKDMFTGSPIVPDSMLSKPANEQVRDYTSGTARKIGDLLGISPLRVEKFIKQNFAEVGNQGMNASDNILAALGQIPKEQIGGRSIKAGLTGALTEARGGEGQNVFYQVLEQNSPNRTKYVSKVNEAVQRKDYGEAKKLAKEYNDSLNNKLSDFNKFHTKDSSLEEALKKAYINDSDKALKSRYKKK